MHRQPSYRQPTFFEGEFPNWQSLPSECQQGLEEILSQLLEEMLERQPGGRSEGAAGAVDDRGEDKHD
jgi:hypothetical protein